jgi:hypothetical protein
LDRKKKWLLSGALIVAGLGIIFFRYHAQKTGPEPAPRVPETSPAPAVSETRHQESEVPTPLKALGVSESSDGVSREKTPEEPARGEVLIDETPVDPQAELENEVLQIFRAEAMETLPLLTIHTADPRQPGKPGPKKGEIWIRIKPAYSRETHDIMGQVADLYITTMQYEEPVTVMLWVGGQPMARCEY